MRNKIVSRIKTFKSWKMSGIVIFSLLFSLIFAYILSFFYFSGASMISKGDGLSQHFSALVYFRQWELNLFKGNAHMWDINIGFGADVLSTVFFYLGPTPLTMFSFLCPERYLEYFYALDIVFRIYMAGIGFIIYAKSKRIDDWAVLVGAVSYCFCGFVLQKAFLHVWFTTPMFYFPMMCWGVDRILKRKSPIPFILITAINGIVNFYFLYMCIIGIAMYILAELFFIKTMSIKEKTQNVLLFAFYGVLSVMIAGVTVFPIINQMLGSGRLGAADVPILYSVKYYCTLFFGFMTNQFRDYDSRTGYVPTAVLAIMILFCFKGEKKLKSAFVVLTVMLCIPMAGSIMNGFGYVSNRWIFIYSFLISYILAKMLPMAANIQHDQLIRCGIILLVYIVLQQLAQIFGILDNVDEYRTTLYLVVAFISLFVFSGQVQRVILVGISILGIMTNIYIEYSPNRNAGTGEYIAKGDAISKCIANTEEIISGVNDQYRIDGCIFNNGNMLQGVKGNNFYYSVVNDSVNRLMRSIERNTALEHQYTGFDNRIALDAISGTQGKTGAVSLPIAFCYYSEMSENDFGKLSPAKKQEALLHNAVIEAPSMNGEKFDSSVNLLYEGTIDERVLEPGKTITLPLTDNIAAEAEILVSFEDVSFEGIPLKEQYEDEWDSLDYYTKSIIKVAKRTYTFPDSVNFTIKCGDKEGNIGYNTPQNRMYVGRNSFCCNMGVMNEVGEELSVSFDQIGVYHVGRVRIESIPIADTYAQIEYLNNGDSFNITFEGNTMLGDISASRDELLYIAVPYSIGWKAYIDGQEAPIYRTNLAFMGIDLPSGNHSIYFEYEVPYFKLGIITCAFGIVLTVVIELLRRRNENSIHST